MSREIDTTVVEMRFDNRQFEDNVKESLSTIDKLKNSLNFDALKNTLSKTFGTIGSIFGNLTYEARNVDLNPIGMATVTVTKEFESLGVVAEQVLRNIVNSAMSTGEQLIKSLTIDNIADGWNKFGEKTVSVGTLISQGFDMDTVTKQLEKLNWYTDETSYTFTEMVANIAKFTATGQELKTSVTAMQGIANWAALSGQNAGVASRAMYNISQAMGAGSMKLIDYRSIQNASMDTDEFREKTLEAAVELGKLKKVADGTYATLDNKQFTKSQFTTQLASGWLDKDVMMKVFNDYSSAIDPLYEYATEHGVTASEAIEALGDDIDSFGLKAFKAAQEARTWADVISSVKEAVASGWMGTFENIFGNYEEAKDLWTDLANELYDVFAEGGNERNEILGEWKELGGRTVLIEAFWKAFYSLVDVVNLVKEAFQDIFPKKTAEELYRLVYNIDEFTNSLKMSTEASEFIKNVLHSIFSIFNIGIKTIGAVVKGLTPLSSGFKMLFHDISVIVKPLNDFVIGFDKASNSLGIFQIITRDVSSAMAILAGYIGSLAANNLADFMYGFSQNGSILSGIFTMLVGNIGNFIKMIFSMASAITGIDFSGVQNTILNVFSIIVNTVLNASSLISTSFNKIFESLTGMTIVDSLKKMGNAIVSVLGFIGVQLSNFFALFERDASLDIIGKLSSKIRELSQNNFSGIIKSVAGFKNALVDLIKAFNPSIDRLFQLVNTGLFASIAVGIKKIIASLTSGVSNLPFLQNLKLGFTDTIEGISETLASFQLKVKAETLRSVAISIAILAGSLFVLSSIDTEGMANGIAGIGALVGTLALVMKDIEAIAVIDKKDLIVSVGVIIGLAIAVSSLTASFMLLSLVDAEGLIKAFASIAGMMFVMVKALQALSTDAVKIPNGLGKATASILLLAVALNLITVPMMLLGRMPIENIGKAMFAMFGSLALMVGLIKAMGEAMTDIPDIGKGIAGILLMSVALNLITIPLMLLGKMPIEAIGKAMFGLLGTIAIMVVILKEMGTVMTDVASAIKGIGGIMLMAVALNMLVVPMTLIGSLPLEAIGKAMFAIVGTLALLSVVTSSMSGSITGAASLILMAVAINMLVSPMMLLGSLPIEAIGKSILAMVGAVAALGVTLAVLGTALGIFSVLSPVMMTGIPIMILMATAMLMLIPVVITFASIPLDKVGTMLLGFAGTLVVLATGVALFSALSVFLAAGVPILLATAAAMALLGLGMNLMVPALVTLATVGAAAVKGFIETLHELAENASQIADDLVTVLYELGSAIPSILGSVILGFCNSLHEYAGPIIEVILEILEDILILLDEFATPLVDIIVQLVLDIVDALAYKLDDICQAVIDLTIAAIDALANTLVSPENAQRMREAIDHFLWNMFDAIKVFLGINSPSTKMEWIGNMMIEGLRVGIIEMVHFVIDPIISLFNVIWEIIQDFLSWFPQSFKMGWDTIKEFMANGLDEIQKGITDAIEAGENFVKGFVEGIKNKKDEIVGSIKNFGTGAIDKLKEILGIHSPSEITERIAQFFAQGFGNGIIGENDNIKDIVNKFGLSALSGLDGLSSGFFNKGQLNALSYMNGWESAFRADSGRMSAEQHRFGADYAVEQGYRARQAALNSLNTASADITEDMLDAIQDMTGDVISDDIMNTQDAATSAISNTSSTVASTESKELQELKAYFDELQTMYNLGYITEEQYHRNRLILLENYKGEWDTTTSGWLKSERDWCREHNVTTNEMMDTAVASAKAMEEVMENTYTSFTENFDKLLEDYQNGLITLEEYDKRYRKLLLDSALVGDKAKTYARSKTSEYVQTLFEPINEEFENKIADIQSKMSSYSDNMRGAIKDAFEIKTNRDVYDETVDSYDKKITELEEKRDKAIEIYGENHWYVKQIQSQIDDINKESEKYQKEYADSGVKDTDIASINFTDKLAEDTKALEEYNNSLSKLMSRGIMPDLKEMVAGMSIDEGKAFVEYLNGLTDAELQNIQDQWTKKKEESDKLSATLYQEDVDAAISKYQTQIEDVMNSLPPEMHAAGVEAMKELGAGFSEATNDTLEIFGQTMFDIKTEAMRMVDEDWAKQWSVMIANSAQNVLDSIGSLDATIKPILDLSEIEKEMKHFQNILNELKTDSGTVYITAGYINQFQEPPEWWEKSRQSTDNSIYTLGQKVDMGFEHVIGAIDDADVQVVLDSNAVSGMANRIIGKLVISKTRGS